MIISNKVEKYDHSHRIVLYETDKSGKCTPNVTIPEIASDVVDSYYEARFDVWNKYLKEVLDGNVSPIMLYFKYHNMSDKDLASRARISKGKLKKHFTMKGFLKMNIKMLRKYASIFDVSVGDFFCFFSIDNDVKLDTKISNQRLIQEINIKK